MNEIVRLAAAPARNRVEFDVSFESDTDTLFWWMSPRGRPCFTVAFLASVESFEGKIEQSGGYVELDGRKRRIWNYVVGSRVPGVFNLGGDMAMFIEAILRKDVASLESYARLCVESMHRRIRGFSADVSTYSLVQGRAFGGGFECALASDTIIAERSAVFCFPEVLFNMIPGMGAISLLGRRVGLRKAQELIMSGQTFSAREMRELGVVDELVEDGTGEQSIRRLIADRTRRKNSYRAMCAARRCFIPVEIAEMRRIVSIWVEAALRLDTKDLRMMARLVRAQDRIMTGRDDEEEDVSALYRPNISVVGQF